MSCVWGDMPGGGLPIGCAVWAEEKRVDDMTIYELGVEYSAAAALLQGRILELEQTMSQEQDEAVRQELEMRIRPLRMMHRETRAVARHLQGYYLRTGRVAGCGMRRQGGRQ